MGKYDELLAKSLSGDNLAMGNLGTFTFYGEGFEKSHVKAHFRRDKTGKLEFIKDYDDARHKGEVEHSIHNGKTYKINNPKSKHHGKIFTVNRYYEHNDKTGKKEYVSGHVDGIRSDLKPEHLEPVDDKKPAAVHGNDTDKHQEVRKNFPNGTKVKVQGADGVKSVRKMKDGMIYLNGETDPVDPGKVTKATFADIHRKKTPEDDLKAMGTASKGDVHVKIVHHNSGTGYGVETTVKGDRRHHTETPLKDLAEAQAFALKQLDNPRETNTPSHPQTRGTGKDLTPKKKPVPKKDSLDALALKIGNAYGRDFSEMGSNKGPHDRIRQFLKKYRLEHKTKAEMKEAFAHADKKGYFNYPYHNEAAGKNLDRVFDNIYGDKDTNTPQKFVPEMTVKRTQIGTGFTAKPGKGFKVFGTKSEDLANGDWVEKRFPTEDKAREWVKKQGWKIKGDKSFQASPGTTPASSGDYDYHLKGFLAGAQDMINAHFKKNYPNMAPPVLSTTNGKKYTKVIRTTDGGKGQKSVWAFINRENGDILKAATWSAPSKHARGNIMKDKNHGVHNVSPYGPGSLR